MAILKQISIPADDTWAIEYLNNLASKKKLSPTVIKALKFYDKYSHIPEQDRTVLALVDMVKELQSQVNQLSSKMENMQFVSSNETGSQEIDSNDWLAELEEME